MMVNPQIDGNAMSAHTQTTESKSVSPGDAKVTTLISCAGVRPLAPNGADHLAVANENRWFDRIGFRKRWYANIASAAVVAAMLYGGVWVVHEFVRLQKLEACFEAGRRDCLPLDMQRRTVSTNR